MAIHKIPQMRDVKEFLKDKGSLSSKVDKTRGTQIRHAQRKSLDWFYKTIGASRDDYAKGSFKHTDQPFIGGMFHFLYDPKWKDTLPYYDKFPLVIPISLYDDGFLGLNLHYVPPIVRAKLLDILIEKYKVSANSKSYMNVSYQILQQAVNNKMFEPCIHRYLTTHMKSHAVIVTPDLWEEVAFLPTQKFEKATHREVWQNSKRR